MERLIKLTRMIRPRKVTSLLIPTFSSSRLSLSNLSGVSLFKILQNEATYISIKLTLHTMVEKNI